MKVGKPGILNMIWGHPMDAPMTPSGLSGRAVVVAFL